MVLFYSDPIYRPNDPVISDTQLKCRLERIASFHQPQGLVKVDEHIVIEVLLILIQHPDYKPANVARALRGHIPSISKEQIVEVFSRYNLEEIGKKKGSAAS